MSTTNFQIGNTRFHLLAPHNPTSKENDLTRFLAIGFVKHQENVLPILEIEEIYQF
jgi:hypothetical protein